MPINMFLVLNILPLPKNCFLNDNSTKSTQNLSGAILLTATLEKVFNPKGSTIAFNNDISKRPRGTESLNDEGRRNIKKFPSLEAQIATISDNIAYNNHDIQDGISARVFSLNDLLEINFFNEIYRVYKKKIKKNNKDIILFQMIRDSINYMVKDLIENSIKNLKKNQIKSYSGVINSKCNLITFSPKFIDIENEIKQFLRKKMYNNKEVLKKNNKGKYIIKYLFNQICRNPKKYIEKNKINSDLYRNVSDYISGMTDRFAINLYNKIK